MTANSLAIGINFFLNFHMTHTSRLRAGTDGVEPNILEEDS